MSAEQIAAGAALRAALDSALDETVAKWRSFDSPQSIIERFRRRFRVPASPHQHWHLDPQSVAHGRYAWFSDPDTPWPSRLWHWSRLSAVVLGFFAVLGWIGYVAWMWAGLRGLLTELAAVTLVYWAVSRWLTGREAGVPLDRGSLHRLTELEDYGVRNHMVSLVLLKPGVTRYLALRTVLFTFNLFYRTVFTDLTPGRLWGLPTIHFAQWTIVPTFDLKGRPRRRKALLFLSNYDGSWETYLDDFLGSTKIWSRRHLGKYCRLSVAARWAQVQAVGARQDEPLAVLASASVLWRTHRPQHPQQRQHPYRDFCVLPGPTTPHDCGSRVSVRSKTGTRASRRPASSRKARSRASCSVASRTSRLPPMCSSESTTLRRGGGGAPMAPRRSAERHQCARAGGRGTRGGNVAMQPGRHVGWAPGARPRSSPCSDRFPLVFSEGIAPADLKHRSRILGDTGASTPGNWQWGGSGHPVDLLLMVFARPGHLARHVRPLLRSFKRSGAGVVVALRSGHLIRKPGAAAKATFEHFGFRDGLSDPIIEGSWQARRRERSVHLTKPGEFLLGYPSEDGTDAPGIPVNASLDCCALLPPIAGASEPSVDFGRNGTYLVCRQLAQDVAAFRRFLSRAADADHRTPAAEAVAARVVGRWRDGTLVGSDPREPAEASNEFGFANDPYGFGCPIGAHLRRANPRDSFAADAMTAFRSTNQHRLLRRGRPYGPVLDEDRSDDDGRDRGLVFIGLNSDIERQFEFVQQNWINNSTFGRLYLRDRSARGRPWRSQLSDGAGKRSPPADRRLQPVREGGGRGVFLPTEPEQPAVSRHARCLGCHAAPTRPSVLAPGACSAAHAPRRPSRLHEAVAVLDVDSAGVPPCVGRSSAGTAHHCAGRPVARAEAVADGRYDAISQSRAGMGSSWSRCSRRWPRRSLWSRCA